MAGDNSETRTPREMIEALARGELSGRERHNAESLLEHSESLRAIFRQLCRARFPNLANYTIVEQIGAGGFGVVYKAIHHAKERTEALKVLFSKTPLLTAYFQNEVQAIARLRHRNIATLYEAQLATPPFYYAMEFVDGERLNDYLKRKEAPLDQRLRLIRTVADALGYAHARDVVHRDIKPQNILVDGDGEPHIVDFGIAKKLEESAAGPDESSVRNPVGTLGYIAPEQMAGRAVDARADVYALGAMLFHCVTGAPARDASRPGLALKLLREDEISRAEDLAAIISRCVATEPDDRYDNCAALVADMDNYVAGRAVAARQEDAWWARIRRGALLTFRNQQTPIRAALVTGMAFLLGTICWAAGARVEQAHDLGDRTVLLGFTEQTVEAIRSGKIGADIAGLSVHDIKSWRALHGRMLSRLALGHPLVVGFDMYFPDCQERYDAEFIRGIEAISARVVVGAARLDVNGAPEICPALRAAAHNVGSLHTASANFMPDEYETPLSIERGYEAPTPSFCVAMFAAARYPDSIPDLRVDADRMRLNVRYRKKSHLVEEARFHDEADTLALQLIHQVGPNERRLLGNLKPGDRLTHARVPLRPPAFWKARTFEYADVFTATEEQLETTFKGRAVVVGQMIAPFDQQSLHNGEKIFGCQVHAEAVDALLAGVQRPRREFLELFIRAAAWTALAGLLVSARPRQEWRGMRGVVMGCVLLFGAAVSLAFNVSLYRTDLWMSELAIALSGLMMSGAVIFMVKALYERQTQLAPQTAQRVSGPDVEEEPTTVLAETAFQQHPS